MFSVFPLPSATNFLTSSHPSNREFSLEGKILVLESHLTKAMLINETLWEIMKQKLNLTDDMLLEEMKKVDLREGKSKECPKCHHMVARHHRICIYCGEVVDNSVFAKINTLKTTSK